MAAKAKRSAYFGIAPSYKQRSTVQTLQAPIGGWNRRDPIAVMPATDAIILDNLVPGNGDVALRGGSSKWVTGLGSYIETLMEYSSPIVNKLFAATPDSIFNVTDGGTVTGGGAPIGMLLTLTGGGGTVSADVSSLTNGRWQYVNFATAAGHFLVAVNGADHVQNYNGSAWSNPTITGATDTDFVNVNVHAQRLWFIQKDSLSAYYLPVSSIAGAATEFPIGQYCKLGGYIVAMGSWSMDGATGMNDLAVFVTSKGEVVVYRGTDPDAGGFAQVGVFRVAYPVGRRCIIKSGSELGVLTAIGLEPLSKVLPYALSTQAPVSVTDKIAGAFREYYSRASTAFGWQVIEYPKKELVIVNAPYAERTTQHQFVMNARTGAWCRFTGLNAGCWGTLGDKIYFGDNQGNVWTYDDQHNDDRMPITTVLQQAYTNFGIEQNKRFVGARPIVEAPRGITPAIVVQTDYDSSIPSLTLSGAAEATVALWDQATWDVALWEIANVPGINWQSVSGIGKVASIASSFATSSYVSINGMDVMFEPGGYF